jgi:hypothetical protein
MMKIYKYHYSFNYDSFTLCFLIVNPNALNYFVFNISTTYCVFQRYFVESDFMKTIFRKNLNYPDETYP